MEKPIKSASRTDKPGSFWIETPQELARAMRIRRPAMERVVAEYPMRINAYFLRLALKTGPALLRQVIPDSAELDVPDGLVDPLQEDTYSPVPNLTHRYPDRVLFLVSDQCGVYCRFCTRKRKIGRWPSMDDDAIRKGLDYIREHEEIRDVLLSGGDPLFLPVDRLEWILSEIRKIRHIEIVRIGSRAPSVAPWKITHRLVEVLRRFPPLYVNVHFNHPAELTVHAKAACRRLADAGIPLGNQTVLLKGVNDDLPVLRTLMRDLMKIRVKPYYLLQADWVRGTNHFRTPVGTGLRLMDGLWKSLPRMSVPAYVLDLPGGGGKVTLLPQQVIKVERNEIVMRTAAGTIERISMRPRNGKVESSSHESECGWDGVL
jgi:lysine 2,3-aminomutase